MKTVSIREAKERLSELIAAAHHGESIVLADGDRKVTLEPTTRIDPEVDSPELEAELLKAANGPFTPYSPAEMREKCDEVVRQRRKRQ